MAEDQSSHVSVDLGDLREIAAWLRAEAQSLIAEFSSTVHFGHYSPCGETQLARRAALSTLDDHRTRWEEHREELTSLATALDKALDHYFDIDDLRKLEQ